MEYSHHLLKMLVFGVFFVTDCGASIRDAFRWHFLIQLPEIRELMSSFRERLMEVPAAAELLDKLGVEAEEDFRECELTEIQEIAKHLKPVQARKFLIAFANPFER